MPTIDELQIEISSSASNASSGIDALAASLTRLRTAVKGGSGLTTVTNQLQKLSQTMATLQAPSQKIQEVVSALAPLGNIGKNNLGATINSLKKIPEITKGLDTKTLHEFYNKIQSVMRIMAPLAAEMEQVSLGFSRLPVNIQKAINANAKLTSSNKSTTKSYGMLGTGISAIWAKLSVTYLLVRRVGQAISGWISESNSYVENLNLFTVAMGEYADSAQAYAEKVGNLLGIDPSAWMRNQGVFNTLVTGFGVASNGASLISKNLTQLGYDLSSFFNISVEDAMQKLQSGISGELEPLRRLGYDLSQTKLQEIAYANGIKTKVAAMNQAQKSQLRYYAIMTQVTTAQGDMARTLTSPANQLRILQAQLTQAARALGNIFIPALNAVLPYAIAFLKVLRMIANEIANFFGYSLPEFDYSGLDGLTSGSDEATEAVNGTTDAIKDLKNATLGIDELNVISPNTNTEAKATSGSNGSSLGLDLPSYDFLGGLIEDKSNELAEKLKAPFERILKLVGIIGAGMLAWKIGSGVVDFVRLMSGLSAFGKLTLGVTLVVAGATIEWQGIIDSLINGLGKLNFTEILGGGTALIIGGALIGGLLGSALLGGAIAAIVAGVPMFVAGVIDALKNGINWLSALLIPIGATAAGTGMGAIIGAAIGSIGGPAGAGIGALVGLAVGAVTDLTILIIQNWEEIKTALSSAWNWLYNTIFAPFINFMSSIATWIYNNVIVPVIGFVKVIYDSVIAPILSFLGTIGSAIWDVLSYALSKTWEIVSGIGEAIWSIVKKIAEIFAKVFEIFIALSKAFYVYVLSPIMDWLGKAFNWIYEKVLSPIINWIGSALGLVYEKIFLPIMQFLGKTADWINVNVVIPIIGTLKGVGVKVIDFMGDLFKGVVNGIFSAIESGINFFIKMLNGAIEIINAIPGINITKVDLLKIPRLASGGYANAGQMFIAREAGPEMVGTIGNRTAVANNDQIVSAVSEGVYDAVVSAMAKSNGSSNSQQSLNVYLDGKKIEASVRKTQRERGAGIMTGGLLSV